MTTRTGSSSTRTSTGPSTSSGKAPLRWTTCCGAGKLGRPSPNTGCQSTRSSCSPSRRRSRSPPRCPSPRRPGSRGRGRGAQTSPSWPTNTASGTPGRTAKGTGRGSPRSSSSTRARRTSPDSSLPKIQGLLVGQLGRLEGLFHLVVCEESIRPPQCVGRAAVERGRVHVFLRLGQHRGPRPLAGSGRLVGVARVLGGLQADLLVELTGPLHPLPLVVRAKVLRQLGGRGEGDESLPEQLLQLVDCALVEEDAEVHPGEAAVQLVRQLLLGHALLGAPVQPRRRFVPVFVVLAGLCPR